MKYELPDSFYDETQRRTLNLKRMRIWALLLIGFALWNLATPFGLIRRNHLSAEFPNSEFGIQRAYISSERELVLERRGYVDRLAKYAYGPGGDLSMSEEFVLYTGVRLDSTPSISSQYRTSGVAIDIKPGPLTLEKIRISSHNLRGLEQQAEPTPTTVPLNNEGKGDIRSIKEIHEEGVAIEDLSIRFMSADNPKPQSLLPGHQYLPFRDSHCYVDSLLDDKYTEPTLYITSDKQRYLHRILLNPDQFSENWIRRDRTAYIDLPLERSFDSYLLHDPDEPEVMLINSDGRISRFDDRSLELISTGFLDGNWQREFASLFQSTSFYSDDFGIPLTRVEAFRVYRILALMLLVGILLLIAGYLPGNRSGSDDEEKVEEPQSSESDKEITISDLRL